MSDTLTGQLPRHAVRLVVTRGISGLGSHITAFGLDVWVYRLTGSYETFALLAVLAIVPNLLLAPMVGVLVDRCNKRTLLMACELIPLLAVLWGLAQLQRHQLGVADVAILITVLSVAGAVRWNTLGPAISILVPAPDRGRLNALQQTFVGVSSMLGPTLGATCLGAFGLPGLLAIDIATFALALYGAWALHPGTLAPGAAPQLSTRRFWQEMTFGFRWVMAHRGLRRILLFFMAFNLAVSIFGVVFTPFLLHFASNANLGWALAAQGAGAFVLGMLLAQRWAPTLSEQSILTGAWIYGGMMILWGLSRSPLALFPLAFVAGGVTSIIMTASQTVWQAEVPPEIQGKVFSARMIVSFSTGPLAILCSIPLATHLFAPMVVAHARLADVWGGGQGGAIGLMVTTIGAVVFASCAALAARGGLALGPTRPSVPPPAIPTPALLERDLP